jgi:hypothetical protein
MKMLMLGLALILPGCGNTMQLLEGADYVCITGDVVGRWTGTRVDGRGVKVPEGETLTPELAEVICR